MENKEFNYVIDNPTSWRAWKAWAMKLEYKTAEQNTRLATLRFVLWVSAGVHLLSGIAMLYVVFGGR